MDNRAVRLPQTTCRNIFAHHSAQQSSRRGQTAPSIRPDKEAEAPSIFQQPAEDELVERNEKGEYVIQAPTPVYRNMALSGLEREAEEETEHENEVIELYGKPNAHSHWDAAALEEEIKTALKSSLKKKVASLEEDKWMFECETDIKK